MKAEEQDRLLKEKKDMKRRRIKKRRGKTKKT